MSWVRRWCTMLRQPIMPSLWNMIGLSFKLKVESTVSLPLKNKFPLKTKILYLFLIRRLIIPSSQHQFLIRVPNFSCHSEFDLESFHGGRWIPVHRWMGVFHGQGVLRYRRSHSKPLYYASLYMKVLNQPQIKFNICRVTISWHLIMIGCVSIWCILSSIFDYDYATSHLLMEHFLRRFTQREAESNAAERQANK